MNQILFRKATLKDIPFLTTTIIEAEKSGTDRLSYSTLFGLNQEQVQDVIHKMLSEEIDNCELSISSFLIAEINGEIAAALSAWLEGLDGVPSAQLKGNLLSFHLPAFCIERAITLHPITKDLHFDYTPQSFQIGAGFVASPFRGKNILGLLTQELISMLKKEYPEISEVYAQIFSCNLGSLKTYQKAGFEIVSTKKSSFEKANEYFPCEQKILLKKIINKN